MPLEQHPTKPDMLVFRGHPAALAFREEHRRKVSKEDLLHKALEELKRVKKICMEEAGIGLCNELLIAELEAALEPPCEFGEMCVYCNPPKEAL